MTDYELFSAFAEAWTLVWLIFATYLTVTFAFLVAGYLVSQSPKPAVATLVVGLYSLVAMWCTFGINRWVATAASMTREIQRAVAEDGSTLAWTTMATTPELVTGTIPRLLLVICVGAYAGAVILLFINVSSKHEHSLGRKPSLMNPRSCKIVTSAPERADTEADGRPACSHDRLGGKSRRF